MQTFWQQETGARTALLAMLIGALTIGLLTGSAYGSGLVASVPAKADSIVLPARKPLILASIAPAEALRAVTEIPVIESQDDTAAPAQDPLYGPFLPAPDIRAEDTAPAAPIITTKAAVKAAPVPPRKPVAAVTFTATLPAREVRALVASLTTRKNTRAARNTAAPAIPRALADADAALYRDIFDFQKKGDWESADALLSRLTDDQLRGHVLLQRYMHPQYKSSFTELAAWMESHAALPGADRVYRLARNRQPAGYKGTLPKPQAAAPGLRGRLAALDDSARNYSSAHTRTRAEQQSVRQLMAAVRRDISAGQPTRALRQLEQQDGAARFLDAVETDQLRAQIAAGYMYAGKIEDAYALAAAAAKRSGADVPMAGWIGGLTAWRLERPKQAAALFELVASSSFTSPWLNAGGAYWAARAHMASGNNRIANQWLRHAANHPRTFYGMIATRALGQSFDFNWDAPRLNEAQIAKLQSIPAARRAMALVAAGEYHLAEQELRHINPGRDREMREALLAYALETGLAGLAMRLAETTPTPAGGLYDAALYPVIAWQPEGGYEVDRALIHAIIRQESRFDPIAQSRSGATGLMQIMPGTAHHIAGDRRFRDAEGQQRLKDPRLNITLGQSYVAELLGLGSVQEDLFALAVAYNAGPGNLRKWQRRFGDIQDDPLLFIESLPVGETRAYVSRVMANYWMYRMRLGQPTPSLDAVASGQFARYVALDGDKPIRVASLR